METIASVLAKLLKRKGFDVFTLQDYMSRVRGGHNFFKICFGNEEINSHSDEIHGIIDLNYVEDEIDAINMAIGASYACTRPMTGTSGGGFSLMVED